MKRSHLDYGASLADTLDDLHKSAGIYPNWKSFAKSLFWLMFVLMAFFLVLFYGVGSL